MNSVLQCLAVEEWDAKDLDVRLSMNRRTQSCHEEMEPVHQGVAEEVEGWERVVVEAKVAKGVDAWGERRQQAQSVFAFAPSAGNDNLISEECHASSKSVRNVAQQWRENRENIEIQEDIIMPRGDGTGPQGLGSMTGRAAGYCSGSGMPGYANAAPGLRLGLGVGRGVGFRGAGFGYGGRGNRCRFFATGLPGWNRFGPYSMPIQGMNPEFEKQVLKNQADAMESELESIKRRLAQFDKVSTGD